MCKRLFMFFLSRRLKECKTYYALLKKSHPCIWSPYTCAHMVSVSYEILREDNMEWIFTQTIRTNTSYSSTFLINFSGTVCGGREHLSWHVCYFSRFWKIATLLFSWLSDGFSHWPSPVFRLFESDVIWYVGCVFSICNWAHCRVSTVYPLID